MEELLVKTFLLHPSLLTPLPRLAPRAEALNQPRHRLRDTWIIDNHGKSNSVSWVVNGHPEITSFSELFIYEYTRNHFGGPCRRGGRGPWADAVVDAEAAEAG